LRRSARRRPGSRAQGEQRIGVRRGEDGGETIVVRHTLRALLDRLAVLLGEA
jgi:hypothetical protein